MKEEKYFRCECCGQMYGEKSKCVACEKSHKHIETVEREEHKPKGVGTDFPTKITVVAKDGTRAVYEYKMELSRSRY